MIVLDTSGVLAALDTSEPAHRAARDAIEADEGPFLISPFVLAELDYMLASRNIDAELDLLRQIGAGAYRLEQMCADDVLAATDLVERYRDLNIGLADASIVLIADRARTRRLLTLDVRHFRAVRPLAGGRFTLLPANTT